MQQAVVLCGGKGTRLGKLAEMLPKPMMPIEGKPLLQRTVELLKQCGFRHIIFAAGYKAEVISDFFRNYNPELRIDVVVEDRPLGTAGPLRLAEPYLNDNFLLVYGDIFLDLDVTSLWRGHCTKRPLATILVRASDHPWDSDLVELGNGSEVNGFVPKAGRTKPYKNVSNCAIYALSKGILRFVPAIPDGPVDFVKDVFPKALRAGNRIVAQWLPPTGYVQDMGTPDRLEIVQKYVSDRCEIEFARANPGPIRAVLLDRDGVLNRNVGLIDAPERVDVLPGVPEALAILTQHQKQCVIVTNQPVIARGLCDEETLNKIHCRLQTAIEAKGGNIRAIYYCPHHPETHHGEGIAELRRACLCRKPRPGLILKAWRECCLNLNECIMIGDSECDIEAAYNAGIRSILIGNTAQWNSPVLPTYKFSSLLDAANAIVSGDLDRQRASGTDLVTDSYHGYHKDTSPHQFRWWWD